MNDRENRQAIPIGVKSRYDNYVYHRVREEANRNEGLGTQEKDREIEQRTEGEPEVLEQIEKQLAKLVDVSKIQMLPADASVCRELILIKVAAKPASLSTNNEKTTLLLM